MAKCIITDDNGTREVEYTPRKRRGFDPAKDGRRFKDIKAGDQLMKSWRPFDFVPHRTEYWVVTDRWFDPVAGQHNASKGDMVAIQQLDHVGKPLYDKRGHTVRGLAAQGYQMADRDWIAFCEARKAEMGGDSNIVGIGAGRRIRQRPKTPGRSL